MPRESFLFNGGADAAIAFSSRCCWWTGFDYANRLSWSLLEPRYVRIAKTTHNRPDAGQRERERERGRESGPPCSTLGPLTPANHLLLPTRLTELSRYSREDARCTGSDGRGECKFSLRSRLPTFPAAPPISPLIAYLVGRLQLETFVSFAPRNEYSRAKI